jgi:hypothetical protein
MRDELSTQGSIQTPWFRTEKGCTGFPEQTQTLSRNQHRLLVQGMYTRVFSEPDTDFSDHRDARRFSAELGTVVLLRARTRSGSPIEWKKEPPRGPPWPFYSHAPGSTLVALETACVPPARITFLGQELRIKNINGTCSFGIIIKYYSQA